MEFYEEGDDIVSFWRPETYYQGWVDIMHGGILSTLIDETCGWVVTRKKQTSGFTTGLNLRFRRAVSTGDPLLTIRARIASQRRNLLTISASLCNAAGEVCVEGEAVYFLMNEDKAREMGFKPCEVEPSDRQEADAALVSAVPRRMRRSDRQMDEAFALDVFDKAPYVTVSMSRPDGRPYGLPLSLVRTDDKTFYFHGALEGDKMNCIACNPIVSLSAVTRCTPTVAPNDGYFTLQYKSATAVGRAELITDREERIAALRAICQRFLPGHMDAFDTAVSRSLERTAVVRITLTEPPMGKRKQYDRQGKEEPGNMNQD